MSGGSFNYAYGRLDELHAWVGTLDSMAACVERHAENLELHKWVDETDPAPAIDARRGCRGKDRVPIKPVAITLDDRARILVKALLLKQASRKLAAAVADVERLQELMHTVEWVESGDSGPDDLIRDSHLK